MAINLGTKIIERILQIIVKWIYSFSRFTLAIRRLEFLFSYFVNEKLSEQFWTFIKLKLDFGASKSKLDEKMCSKLVCRRVCTPEHKNGYTTTSSWGSEPFLCMCFKIWALLEKISRKLFPAQFQITFQGEIYAETQVILESYKI